MNTALPKNIVTINWYLLPWNSAFRLGKIFIRLCLFMRVIGQGYTAKTDFILIWLC